MYVNEKMLSVETIPEMGGGGDDKEVGGGANSIIIYLIYCNNFCECHNVPPTNITVKKKKKIILGIRNT
jgi:hypothetical protein